VKHSKEEEKKKVRDAADSLFTKDRWIFEMKQGHSRVFEWLVSLNIGASDAGSLTENDLKL
jgi:hypothetical protein